MKKGSSTPTLDEGRVTSPGIPIEEIVPRGKKRKTGDKGKKKVGASIQADEAAVARVNEVMMPEDLKEIFVVPSHEMVNRHVHKLFQVVYRFFLFYFIFLLSLADLDSLRDCDCQVLGETMHITSQYLMSEEKAVVASSKVKALEAEAFSLKKDLIEAMDSNNLSKEKIQALTKQLNAQKLLVTQKDEQITAVNQKMKNVVAKAVHAFQLTDEYNVDLFGW